MRFGLTALALATAALLAGCTTAVVGTAHDGNVSSPSARPTPTTTSRTPLAPPTALTAPSGSLTGTFGYWTTSDAQRQFLDLANQHNSEIAVLDQALCGCGGPVELLQLTDACDALASNDKVAAVAFIEDPWPANAVSAARALAAAINVEAVGFTNCANASTVAEADSALERTKSAAQQAAAMRAVLGLPALPQHGNPSPITA